MHGRQFHYEEAAVGDVPWWGVFCEYLSCRRCHQLRGIPAAQARRTCEVMPF